jgi:hypothetical protein
MAIVETINVTSFAEHDLVLPANHTLSVKVSGFETPLHRLSDVNVVKRNYQVDDGETFSIVSPRETRWRIGPVVSYAIATISSPD